MTGRRALAGIKDHIRTLLAKEEREYESLMDIIDELPKAEQRQVMMARYMDGLAWDVITAIVYGQKGDFEEKTASYERRIFRIHGIALIHANRIITERKQGKIDDT